MQPVGGLGPGGEQVLGQVQIDGPVSSVTIVGIYSLINESRQLRSR